MFLDVIKFPHVTIMILQLFFHIPDSLPLILLDTMLEIVGHSVIIN